MTDSHAHIGCYGAWDLRPADLIARMDAAGVDRAVVGDIAGNTQGASCFEETLRAIEPYRARLLPLLWVCPSLKGDAETAAEMLERHSDRIAGIKLHPATAHVRPDSPECAPYLRLCERYGIPFVSHTVADGLSDIRFPAEAAKAHPAVRFVAVHCEMRTDHLNAAAYIAAIPNLYGDTTLVRREDVLWLIRLCGAAKLLFGTDAPVPGTPCYEGVPALSEAVHMEFGTDIHEALFHANCASVFPLTAR